MVDIAEGITHSYGNIVIFPEFGGMRFPDVGRYMCIYRDFRRFVRKKVKMNGKTLRRIIPHYISYCSTVGNGYQSQPIDMGEDSNAVFAFVNESGLKRSNYYTCFGELADYYSNFGYSSPEALFVQFQHSMVDSRIDSHLYYEWLFNYSPWRSIFVTKNITKLHKNKVIIIDTSQDADLMIGGAIACRHPWEAWSGWDDHAHNIVVLWQELVKKGNDPTASFVFANQMRLGPIGWYTSGTSFGHQALTSYAEGHPHTPANFIEEKLTPFGAYVDKLSYNSPHDCWDGKRSKSNQLDLYIDKVLADGVKGEVVNPFSKETKVVNNSLDKVLSVFKDAIPAYKELIKET